MPDPAAPSPAHRFLEAECRALLTRLHLVKPFALQIPAVPAAAVSVEAQAAIERMLAKGRRDLALRVGRFLAWLGTAPGRRAGAAELQRHYARLRLGFNAVLNQMDLFADALVQRSEHENGTWLGGLDVLARDALALPTVYDAPPVVCYLDRGAGAAIRRAQARIPGGGATPVAILRVPRERMIGAGLASSVVHETGHQAAALLDLVASLQGAFRRAAVRSGGHAAVWRHWELWIPEIVADFWAIARVGVTSTLGLIQVVSLPAPLVFRITPGDPHPFPWIRVRLSCAIGAALYPDPQWARLAALWESLYPRRHAPAPVATLIEALEATLSDAATLLVQHRVPALGGRTLPEALDLGNTTPDRLRRLWRDGRSDPALLRALRPTMAFAVIGQARVDEAIDAAEEAGWLRDLLTGWAVSDAVGRAGPGRAGWFRGDWFSADDSQTTD